MWEIVHSDTEPIAIDRESSKVYDYFRKNIELITKEDGGIGYRYEEMKVDKSLYEIMISQFDNLERLNDIEEAIVEIIGG